MPSLLIALMDKCTFGCVFLGGPGALVLPLTEHAQSRVKMEHTVVDRCWKSRDLSYRNQSLPPGYRSSYR